jgi:large subunit ribosomal protein L23
MGFFNRKKDDAKDAKKSNAPKAAKPEKAEAAAEEPSKEAPKAAAAIAPRATGQAYRVLVRPIITEKMTRLGQVNQYAFEVAMTANKLEIRKAVEAVYGVTPTVVRVMRIYGKPVRSRAGMSRRSTWRKAIVTLKKGDRIDMFANA